MLRYIEVTESDILFNYGNSLISPGRGKKQSHPHQVGFIDLDWRYIFLLRVLILFVDYEDVTLLTFICSICIAILLPPIPALYLVMLTKVPRVQKLRLFVTRIAWNR